MRRPFEFRPANSQQGELRRLECFPGGDRRDLEPDVRCHARFGSNGRWLDSVGHMRKTRLVNFRQFSRFARANRVCRPDRINRIIQD